LQTRKCSESANLYQGLVNDLELFKVIHSWKLGVSNHFNMPLGLHF